jgi:hypothetical protein
VGDRAAGTRRLYQLDPDGIAALRADVDRFWAQALDTFKQMADETGDDIS